MLKKPNRLTSKFQFNIVRKYGTKYSFDYFNATVLKPLNYEGPAKIGFVVPNAVDKKAAHRNRVKRLLREAIRKNLDKIPNNRWISIGVNNKILGKNYEEVGDQVDRFIQKISISN